MSPICFCENGSRKRYLPKATVSIWCFLAPFLLILDHCKICRLISLRKGDCLWSTAQWPCPESEWLLKLDGSLSPPPQWKSAMHNFDFRFKLDSLPGSWKWWPGVDFVLWLWLADSAGVSHTTVPFVPPDKNEWKAKLIPGISCALLCWVINKLGLILFGGGGNTSVPWKRTASIFR